MLIELVLRLLFPSHLVVPSGRWATRADSELIYSLRPGITVELQRTEANGGQTIVWRTNAEGYRGGPLRAHHDKRVAVFGDSNIHGAFSSDENTFAVRLERLLKDATGSDVEVVNAGVFGYGPDQSLLRLTREIGTLKPDVVVFHVYADNDYGDMIRNRLFTVSGGVLARHPSPFRYPRRSFGGRLQDFAASLLITKAAFKVVRTFVPEHPGPAAPPREPARYAQDIQRLSQRDWREYTVHPSDSALSDHYDIDVATAPDSEPARTKVALMDAVLGAARDVARREGAGFLVLIQPSSIDMTTNLALSYQNLPGLVPGYRRERLTEIVRNICLARGIAFVDLYPVFAAAHPDSLYFHADDHWNDAGQRLAARTVAPAVLPLLGPRAH